MMPVIRVTDATWERMKRHARPLEDTPDDIVKRALDALEGIAGEKRAGEKRKVAEGFGRPPKMRAGSKLPQKEFRNPLLLALDALGGSGSKDTVREAIRPLVDARLKPADFNTVATGEQRWWNAVCWERSALVKEGLLRSDSPRGRWELSDKGYEAVSAIKRSR